MDPARATGNPNPPNARHRRVIIGMALRSQPLLTLERRGSDIIACRKQELMFATSAPRILKAVFFAASGFVLGAGIMFWSADRGEALEEVNTLLVTSETILGRPFSYPAKKPARVTAAIVTMPPGGTTGWHEHPVPLFG